MIYPIKNEIPDFYVKTFTEKNNEIPLTKSMGFLDILSNIYESPIWYCLVYHMYGGIKIPRIKKTIEKVVDLVKINNNNEKILDVACGTGIYTRPLAKKVKKVYGIDISLGMLKKAKELATEKTIFNLILARADVERLPFKNDFFDGAICCGALHLFPNTIKALKEIARVLKTGSDLAVMTFIRRRFLKYPWIYKHIEEDHGAHIFGLKELSLLVKKAGFIQFYPIVYGSMLLFSARKQ
jgi:SAM-dependent methyltransferase